MTHEEVKKAGTAAQYLQGRLSEKEREEFEEHLFCCPECAGIVQADLILKAHGEVSRSEDVPEEDEEEEKNGPALGSLLRWAVVHPRLSTAAMVISALVLPWTGYQNLYLLPELNREREWLNRPRAAASYYLKGQARGSQMVVTLKEGCQEVILEIEVASANDYSSFRGLLVDRSWSVLIPPEAVSQFSSRLIVPCSQLPPGENALELYGLKGDSQTLAETFRFETQLE